MTPDVNTKLSTGGFFSRRRNALLAGALVIGSAGLVAGLADVTPTTPAFAETKSAMAPIPMRPYSFADLVERVRPAVVSVRVKSKASPQFSQFRGFGQGQGNPLEKFFKRFEDDFGMGRPKNPRSKRRAPMVTGQGSGFIISEDGYIVTNNHVIKNAESVAVVLADGTEIDAKIVGHDEKTDLALLKIVAKQDLPTVKFADKDVRVGDWVVAVGNPFGLGGTVTAGIVSARGREIGAGLYDDFIQIDASINKGNSGGPAFDLSGNVVGVNTAIFSPTGGSVGIGFAIPAATAKTIIEDLKDDGNVTRGWLGVHIQNIGKDIAESLGLDGTKGALVTEASPGSPAYKAGIRSGDTILKVDDQTVKSSKDLARRISKKAPGASVMLEIWRGGQAMEIEVKLGELKRTASNNGQLGNETPDPQTTLGLTLAPSNNDDGVTVTSVDPNSAAARKGLRNGDVILEVAGTPVTQPGDVNARIQQVRKQGRKAVLMRLQSGNQTRFVALPLG